MGRLNFLMAALVAGACQNAIAQLNVPADALPFSEDAAKVEAIEGGLVRIRDSKNEVWLLKVGPQAKVTVTGEAEADNLRPGLFVQFTGEFDKKGNLKDDVDELEIFAPEGKGGLGVYPASDDDDAKPLRTLSAGTFHVKGRVASYHDGELMVVAGRQKVPTKLADDAEITFTLDDMSLAQVGDEAKVKAWYYEMQKPIAALNQPGNALVEEITFKLSRPLPASGKKSRPVADRPERPAKTKKAGR